MVLVDTSVWVKHLRDGETILEHLLEEGEVICHPFVVSELACGNLRNRAEILELLQALPMATVAKQAEVLLFLEENRLMCKGLGLVDLHLLASAVLSEIPLWTFDRRLHRVSLHMGLAY